MNWDASHQDIHLDKDTEYKIDGRKQRIRIKLSLNSDRPISITTRHKRELEIPNSLKKEVQNVFQDGGFRKKIVAQLSDILDNYPSKILENQQKLEIVIEKICIAFGIPSESLRKDNDIYLH